MGKTFRNYFIEKFNPGLYEPVEDAKGEKRFIAKHKIQKHADPEGNGPDVFQAAKIKTYDRSAHRMGNNAGEDEAKYEDWDHGFSDEELDLIVDNMTVEEYEQLDELSKKLLKKYVRHAAYDLENHAGNMRELENFSDQDAHGGARNVARKIDNRHGGIKRALNKLTKEETDLQELSRKTLANYIDKAAYSAGNHAYDAGMNHGHAGKSVNKSMSRLRGVTRAANKMAGQMCRVHAKEGADLVELSKHTLVSYVNKASKNAVVQGHHAGVHGINKKNSTKAINRVTGITKAAGRLAYGGGHALSNRQSHSGITVKEGKTFKDMRKFGDSDRENMRKRLQARMQARKAEC